MHDCSWACEEIIRQYYIALFCVGSKLVTPKAHATVQRCCELSATSMSQKYTQALRFENKYCVENAQKLWRGAAKDPVIQNLCCIEPKAGKIA